MKNMADPVGSDEEQLNPAASTSVKLEAQVSLLSKPIGGERKLSDDVALEQIEERLQTYLTAQQLANVHNILASLNHPREDRD
jgi:hypothetical protein